MDNGAYTIIKRAYAILSKEKGTLTNSDIAVLGGYLETLIEVYADTVEPPAAPPKPRGPRDESRLMRIARSILPG